MASDSFHSRERDSRETLRGIDNIALDLPLAGLASRGLAAAIDYLLLMLLALFLLLVWGLIFMTAGSIAAPSLENLAFWWFAVLIFGWFFVNLLYFMIQEMITGGQTLGKRAMHLRVVGRNAGAATPVQFVLRNLLKPLDMVLAVPFMALDPQSRRLGDRVAGTLVIHDRPAAKTEIGLGRVPRGWGPRKIAVAENLLLRHEDMQPERFQRLALRLLQLVEQDDPALLEHGPDPHRDPHAALQHAFAMGGAPDQATVQATAEATEESPSGAEVEEQLP